MLALFGAVPDRLLRAYAEVQPLQGGWEERSALFQLAPLLVHAVLFGGGYQPRRRPWHGASPERQTSRSTSSRYLALTGSGRNAARNELRASSASASRGRSNASATALKLSPMYPPK